MDRDGLYKYIIDICLDTPVPAQTFLDMFGVFQSIIMDSVIYVNVDKGNIFDGLDKFFEYKKDISNG